MTPHLDQETVIRELAGALEQRMRMHDGSVAGNWLIGVANALRELAGELAGSGHFASADAVLQAAIAVLWDANI